MFPRLTEGKYQNQDFISDLSDSTIVGYLPSNPPSTSRHTHIYIQRQMLTFLLLVPIFNMPREEKN